jgi:ADP-L-glycero-D-manno-heptose 6-epimerase
MVWWLLQHPEVNGIFNLGVGHARSWNELAAAVFAAMDRPFAVDYIDMPESIREKYQYFTQANMSRLSALGCPMPGRNLNESVADYIRGYLSREDPYL